MPEDTWEPTSGVRASPRGDGLAGTALEVAELADGAAAGGPFVSRAGGAA